MGGMTTALEIVTAGGKEYRSGRYAEAEATARRALEADPRCPYAFNLLGAAQAALGRPADAAASLSQALQLRPDYADAANNLGAACSAQGQLEQAVECFQRAVRLQPNYAAAHENLGGALLRLKHYAEAEEPCRMAVCLRPKNPDNHNNLGVALLRQKKFAEALPHFECALLLRPDDYRFHGGMAAAYHGVDRPGEVETCLREVLRLRPDDAETHNGLGWSYHVLGRFAEARKHLDEALRLQPDHHEAHLNRAIGRLLHGDYAEGWKEYEWRWKGKDLKMTPFTQPLWDGGPLGGKTILLHTEQGIGDTLQFIRYAPLVKARGGMTTLACDRKLARLLQRCPGLDQIIIKGDPKARFDVHIPLLSLPRVFGTLATAPPGGVPYVHPDPALVERWRTELAPRRGFKVGIAWRGSPKNPEDRQRSIPLDHFERLARGGRSALQFAKGRERQGAARFHDALSRHRPGAAP